MAAFLDRLWYGESPWQRWLAPASHLFARLVEFRRRAYREGLLKSRKANIPVVVVGNITVGGTGKTPVTLWLAERLKDLGSKPGIVSRGYGGHVGDVPVHVTEQSDPAAVGDEPLLMARRVVCPVAVHPDRFAAAELLAQMGCDVVIADDGLQHYGLARQFEIAVVDGRRGFGNGRLLPAGPLREPVDRLRTLDRIMLQARTDERVEELSGGNPRVTRFTLTAGDVRSLHGANERPLESFSGQAVHAIAGIGNPQGFFELLETHGLSVIPHAFADHAVLSRQQLEFGDDRAVIMTEKDAVKCEAFAPANAWYLAVAVAIAANQDLSWLGDLAGKLRSNPVEQEA
ncbi:MAG TPA: tetraacyldisaccharide 4'-kinase [Woeseiaceae bacterium]|nr:tetraacyldisaccharide 4'-kinase [Woeseiaceae bacterium]